MRITRLPSMAWVGIFLALTLIAGNILGGKASWTTLAMTAGSRVVKVPAIERPRLEAVVLDSSIFAAAKPNLTDLRLRSDDGPGQWPLCLRAGTRRPRSERS